MQPQHLLTIMANAQVSMSPRCHLSTSCRCFINSGHQHKTSGLTDMLLDAADMKLLLKLLSWVYQHKPQELLAALALLLDPESNCTNDMRCAPSTASLMKCLCVGPGRQVQVEMLL